METQTASRSKTQAPVIFMHIPKTAGSTILSVIAKQYSAESTFRIYGKDIENCKEILTDLQEERKDKIKCLIGHIPFGLHKYLPQETAIYLTMLRDPVDRVLSHYYYVLRSPGHYFHKELVSKNISLEEYVMENKLSELNNGQVRLLSGIESVDSVYGHGPVTESVFETAKHNLEVYFNGVGLCENFDESLLMFKNLMGWKNVFYKKKNVTQKRPAKQDVPKHILQTIEQYNAFDLELYEFVRSKFEEICWQSNVREKQVSFRLMNYFYGKAIWLKSRIVKHIQSSAAWIRLLIKRVSTGL